MAAPTPKRRRPRRKPRTYTAVSTPSAPDPKAAAEVLSWMRERMAAPPRPSEKQRPRVVVRGPSDPAEATALRRAMTRDLAELAVDLLAEGNLPPAKGTEHRRASARRTAR